MSRKCPPLNVVRSRRSNIRQTVGRRDGVGGGESAADGACSQREVTLSTPHTSAQLGYLCCLFAHLNASFRRRCGYLYPFGDVAAISTYSRPRNLGDISARWRQTRLARPPRRSGEADSPPRKEIDRGRTMTWRWRRRTGSRLEKKSRVAEERNGRSRRGASSPA